MLSCTRGNQMTLPQPSLSFTLPSIHDNTRLDCRVYHPQYRNAPPASPDIQRPRHAAIVAHPYSPLGGSYDDPIVHLIASTLLQIGFVVATFNFRGASSSNGRTSWTSKPERADYMSVAGFLVYYMHYLRPRRHPHVGSNQNVPPAILLFAGYSYGAMVTVQLPPLDSFLSRFSSPSTHTPFSDIRLRAQHLAEQQVIISAAPSSPRKSLGMRVGGDEDTYSQQKTRDNPRAHSPDREERIRKGVKDLLSRSRLTHRKHDYNLAYQSGGIGEEAYLGEVDNLIRFCSAYLLVSPPMGIVTNLVTMTFSNPLSNWSRRRGRALSTSIQGRGAEQGKAETETKLMENPTMVVYGDQDGFLALKKMHDWTTQLSSTERSQFHYVEVSGAGHFWVEENVVHELREVILSFATRLVGN
ncbi:Alpha/Beta hydrolase protein [Hypoxylon sp. NC1633]|nr:Alpha/Beta hydrolase protein [Hypoxylon sp. NC1633]